MDRKLLLLLSFFASHKDEYMSENDLPVSITSEFDGGMELPNYLYQLQIKKLIEQDRKRSSYYKITTDGYEKVRPHIDSHEKEQEMSKLIEEKVKLEVHNLRDEYFNSDIKNSQAKKATNAAILASVAALLTLMLAVFQWMCNKSS